MMKGNTISGHRPSICKINSACVGLVHIDKEAQPLYVSPTSIDHDAHIWNGFRGVKMQIPKSMQANLQSPCSADWLLDQMIANSVTDWLIPST